MIIKDVSELHAPIIPKILPVSAPVSADTGGDWLSRFERIIGNVNGLLDAALRLKGQAGIPPPNGSGHPPAIISPQDAGRSAPPVNNRNEVKKPMLPPQVIALFDGWIDAAIKENPNMDLAEFLAKIPVNVTQLKGLLALAKGGK